MILTGKDIELLLLKKDVEDKLDSLSSISVKTLAPTTNKRVEFVAGDVDLGYLHDYDRPLLSKLRPRRCVVSGGSGGQVKEKERKEYLYSAFILYE